MRTSPRAAGNFLNNTAIYTTKIDGVVCPPNISETVAGRLMKLTHRPRIASTMIKLISKPILLPILLILVKTIQRIVADPKRKFSPPFHSADSVPSLGHLAPGSGKMLSLFTVLCDYSVWVTETGSRVRVKRFSQSEFSSTTAAVARTTFRLECQPWTGSETIHTVPSHALNASLL